MSAVLSNEQLPEHLDTRLILAVHDELVVESPEDQIKEVAQFVKEVIVAGMGEMVNPGLDVDYPDRVPIEVDVKPLKRWGDNCS